MIYDIVKNKDIYTAIGDKYEKAFAFINEVMKNGIEVGRYNIDGDDIYANVSTYDTKFEGCYEAHKRYIDLQFILEGHEQIYWKNIKDCKIVKEYEENGDYLLLEAEEPIVLDMHTNSFAIFYPEDVHAPGRIYKEVSTVKKIVIKIRVD